MNDGEVKTFTFINDEKLIEIIESAERHIIYAAPSISLSVAKALNQFIENKVEAKLRVIIDAQAESFRLGFGEHEGLKFLYEKNTDIRRAENLRIAVIVADENVWIYAPTPQIIFEQPDTSINNAVKVNVEFAQQILFSVTPDISIAEKEEILEADFLIDKTSKPEIGETKISVAEIEEVEEELKANPPQKFDLARKVRVYQGKIQFVELHLTGCRLRGKTITLPKYIIDVEDKDFSKRLKTTYRVEAKRGNFAFQAGNISERLRRLRARFITSLGERYGSVILRRERAEFDREIESIRKDLEQLKNTTIGELESEMKSMRENLVEILLPKLLQSPDAKIRRFGSSEEYARLYLESFLRPQLPRDWEILEKIQLICDYKDVTFEMLNDEEFIEIINQRFPYEDFEKLYSEEVALGKK